jgi:hypothetical protein
MSYLWSVKMQRHFNPIWVCFPGTLVKACSVMALYAGHAKDKRLFCHITTPPRIQCHCDMAYAGYAGEHRARAG